jgi:hypothetical protein
MATGLDLCAQGAAPATTQAALPFCWYTLWLFGQIWKNAVLRALRKWARRPKQNLFTKRADEQTNGKFMQRLCLQNLELSLSQKWFLFTSQPPLLHERGVGWLEPDFADIGSRRELAPVIITLTCLDPQRWYWSQGTQSVEEVNVQSGVECVLACG